MGARAYTISSLLAAIWLGSMTAIGFFAVPTTFATLPELSMAGNLAARFFYGQGWISMVCIVLLVMFFRTSLRSAGDPATGKKPDMWYFGALLLGFFLALFIQQVVQPRILARDNLALWHNLGTALYVLEWACAVLAVLRLQLRKV